MVETPAVKKILSGGKSKPEFRDGTKALFHFKVEIIEEDASTTFLEDSREKWPRGYGAVMELIFGKKFQLPIWETCLKTMLVDEISSFDVEISDCYLYPMVSKKLRDIAKDRDGHSHDHEHQSQASGAHTCFGLAAQAGLGYPELDGLLAKPRRLRFSFHLLEVQQANVDYRQQSWQLDAQQRLASVQELRLEGNRLCRDGDWSAASDIYKEALGRLESLLLREKPGDEEHTRLDLAKVPLFLNLCQCRLSLGEYYEAMSLADEALERDGENEKALFRRAKALTAVHEFDKAIQDLNKLKQCHPLSTSLVDKELTDVLRLKRSAEMEAKERYKSMITSS